MQARIERDVRCYKSTTTDGHCTGVDDGAIEIDEDVLAEDDIRAVIDAYWCFNPSMFFEKRLVFFLRLGLGRERGGVADDTG